MTLIKDEARWVAPVGGAGIGCLNHHQRMIGDNNIGTFCRADRFFDKATIIMRTGRMDTFAAPISQSGGLRPTQQIQQPGRKAGTGQITIAAGTGPAGHKSQCGGAARLPGHLQQRLFQIKQTQVIFAAFAQDDLCRPLTCIRIEPRQLRRNLMLQGSCIG